MVEKMTVEERLNDLEDFAEWVLDFLKDLQQIVYNNDEEFHSFLGTLKKHTNTNYERIQELKIFDYFS